MKRLLALPFVFLLLGVIAPPAAAEEVTPGCSVTFEGTYLDFVRGFPRGENPPLWNEPDEVTDAVASFTLSGLTDAAHTINFIEMGGPGGAVWRTATPATWVIAVADSPVSSDFLNNADGSIDIGFTGTTATYYMRTPANWAVDDVLTLRVTTDGETNYSCSTTIMVINTDPPFLKGPKKAPKLEPLTAVDHNYSVVAGSTLKGDATVGNSLPDGTELTLRSQPTFGKLTWAADGTYSYTAPADFNGTDIFSYMACQPASRCLVGTETISIHATSATVTTPPAGHASRGVSAHTGDVDGVSALVGVGALGILAALAYAFAGTRFANPGSIRFWLLGALGLLVIDGIVRLADLVREWSPTRAE